MSESGDQRLGVIPTRPQGTLGESNHPFQAISCLPLAETTAIFSQTASVISQDLHSQLLNLMLIESHTLQEAEGFGMVFKTLAGTGVDGDRHGTCWMTYGKALFQDFEYRCSHERAQVSGCEGDQG